MYRNSWLYGVVFSCHTSIPSCVALRMHTSALLCPKFLGVGVVRERLATVLSIPALSVAEKQVTQAAAAKAILVLAQSP